MQVVQEHVRMNDYVGPGIYATVTWNGPCPKGEHSLGLLTLTCGKCGAQASVKYEARHV